MAVETANRYANVLSRTNIVNDNNDPLPDSYTEARAREDLDARLTGDFAGGRFVTAAEAAPEAAAAEVITLQSGSADQDENQLIVLPEDVEGTFTITLSHSGGGPTATSAINLDASAATVQSAVDAVTGTANEVVVTKATGRRAFGLTWSHANEDLTNFAQSTVAVTETGERGLDT